MYKKLFLLLIIMVVLAKLGYAGQIDTAIALAKVQVATVFAISLDRTDIDFGEMRPGEVKYDIPATGIKVTTKTNTGNKWYLLINTLTELRAGDRYIDNKYFGWYGWTEGQGKWFGTGDNSITLNPFTVYESSVDEGLNLPNGTNNIFKFKLDLPKDQPAGRYEASVRFTLTE
ncbi:MAG: hypothetical protein WC860_07565 [Candidatus Margulisiibacteriota bacterium]|jgi:hypothetical protein